ncbi:MAG: hypothetical protein ABIZ09_03580 [Rhodoferax sp.]
MLNALALCMLSACGGGGSSATNPGLPPAPTPTVFFSVGGTIVGLGNTTGLTLVNGAETLPVSANATSFIFANKVAQNGAYDVKMGSQPAGATCSMSNATGAEVVADIQTIAINCVPEPRSSPYLVSTFAGDDGQTLVDGVGAAARFNAPLGMAKDSAGNFYVIDANTIRKISSLGAVSTLAGGINSGFVDGAGSVAQFSAPRSLAVDVAGNVYVADSLNHAIRKISPAGVVSTLSTGFNYPSGIAIDSAGNLYVADGNANTIHKITPTGEVSTLAGDGIRGHVDAAGTAARFTQPVGVTVDSSGNVYVTESSDVRKITPSGIVSTVAGNSQGPGHVDGIGSAARFDYLGEITIDGAGNLYVADQNSVRKISPGAAVSTVVGSNGFNFGNGVVTSELLHSPSGLVSDGAGNILVADSQNRLILQISSAGIVKTLAGQGPSNGYVEAIGTFARFYEPRGVATDAMGNVYVADSINNVLRKITPLGAVTSLAGSGRFGSVDATGAAAQFQSLGHLAADNIGNVYAVDNGLIRKISPTGVVTTLQQGYFAKGVAVDSAGTLYFSSDTSVLKRTPDGVVSKLADGFGNPCGLAVDGSGYVYVADYDKNVIFKVSPQGQVSTLAGGSRGLMDGVGTAAMFSHPIAVAVNNAGDVYVTGDALSPHGLGSYFGGAVRKITISGVVTTIAGDGTYGHVDAQGSNARFNFPNAIAVDTFGNLYVADDSAVRKIAPQ